MQTNSKNLSKSNYLTLGLLMSTLLAPCVMAQTVSPSMGGASVDELQRGVNPRQVGGVSGGPVVAVPAISDQDTFDKADSTILPIAGFHVVGQTVFEEKQLLEVAKAKAGEYRFSQLQSMAAAITGFYRDHGYLVAQAVIPAQEARNGVVQIRIIEGKLEPAVTVVTENKDAEEAIQKIYRDVVCPKSGSAGAGDQCLGVIATDTLIDRIVLLARENTAMKVFGSLSAGVESGYTRLTLNAQPERRVMGEVSVDNSGGTSTGRWHAQGHIVANSLLKKGDTLDLLAGLSNKPSDFKFFQADYSVPVGGQGWRLGANVAQTQYSLGDAFSALQQSGVSRSLAFYARYPLSLKANARTDLTLSVKAGQLRDDNLAFSNPRTYWESIADVSSRLEDSWMGAPAINLWGARWEYGTVRINDALPQLVDSNGLHTAGTFNRLTLRGSREQGLGGQWSLFGALSGMAGDKNLDPYFKFSLGGPYGVRAYASGEAAGDEGALGTIELRYAFSPLNVFSRTLSTRMAVFYDRGWVKNSRYPLSNLVSNTEVRAGTGVQFEISDNNQLGLRVFWATQAGTGASRSDGTNSRVGILANAAF